MSIKVEDKIEDRINKALGASEVPKLYVNGFIIFLGQADVGLILQTNAQETAVVNMSFTLAKTLVEKLGDTMRDFEEKTGTIIMTTDTVREKTTEGSNETKQ